MDKKSDDGCLLGFFIFATVIAICTTVGYAAGKLSIQNQKVEQHIHIYYHSEPTEK